ncbi:hypothetical protein GOP47_0005608 [Adiantum capillus-veneris]|uniref:Uncharacterized protein n=1 Tax=Adiantum capillus-veneris TaxID=13818 RepID=A0A9D4V5F9_ADICA|nr:hypothetical protein GOP47_0005608 [Adiantum capillus-veneris]
MYLVYSHSNKTNIFTLRRLRYMLWKILERKPLQDEKTFNILNIPPSRKPKGLEVLIEEFMEEDEEKMRETEETNIFTLRRLRYMLWKILERKPLQDEKTFNILNIPPSRKPKGLEVLIEEFMEEDEEKMRETEETNIERGDLETRGLRKIESRLP